MWNVKRVSSLLRSASLGPNITGTGSFPAKMLFPFDRQLIAPQLFTAWSFYTVKLCSRLFIFLSKFMRKTSNLGIWIPFWTVIGVTHDLGWWLVGKSMVDFLFVLIELFRYLLRFLSYEAKCVQLGCFRRGSTSLHSNFTCTRSSPINHSWCEKARDTGLPDGEDRIPLRSLILTQYRSITDRQTDRQMDLDRLTDGRICRSIYSACKASFAGRCKKYIDYRHSPEGAIWREKCTVSGYRILSKFLFLESNMLIYMA